MEEMSILSHHMNDDKEQNIQKHREVNIEEVNGL